MCTEVTTVYFQGACSLQTGEAFRNQDTGALSDRVCQRLCNGKASIYMKCTEWQPLKSYPILGHAWWAFAVPHLFLQVVPWCKAFTALSLNSNIQTSILFHCTWSVPPSASLISSFLHCCLPNRCNYSPINLMQHFSSPSLADTSEHSRQLSSVWLKLMITSIYGDRS